jgi:hypothetical protein
MSLWWLDGTGLRQNPVTGFCYNVAELPGPASSVSIVSSVRNRVPRYIVNLNNTVILIRHNSRHSYDHMASRIYQTASEQKTVYVSLSLCTPVFNASREASETIPVLFQMQQPQLTRVLACYLLVSMVITSLLASPTSGLLLGHSLNKRSFFEIQCKGVYDKSIFARLDRICEDCYNLFREPQLHSLCRYTSLNFTHLKVLSSFFGGGGEGDSCSYRFLDWLFRSWSLHSQLNKNKFVWTVNARNECYGTWLIPVRPCVAVCLMTAQEDSYNGISIYRGSQSPDIYLHIAKPWKR